MGRTKKTTPDSSLFGMLKPPFIYISDPTCDAVYAKVLATLIPNVLHFSLEIPAVMPHLPDIPGGSQSVILVSDFQNDYDNTNKIENGNLLKSLAIAYGSNFASINLMHDLSRVSEADDFGPNHLDLQEGPDAAETIYKWLFTVLTVRETLHLIPEEQMKKVDKKQFPDYEYCPISESKQRPKNAKIQFVALIMSKPQIVKSKKLVWSVADRTGVANFYFHHRGPSSQYTWDWVLKLKPGDRKVLPRLPMVTVKEKKRVQLAKAPFRATGSVLGMTGFLVKATGEGICKLAKAVKMGSSSEWVSQADVGPDGKRIDWSQLKVGPIQPVKVTEKKTINVFNEKGGKNWDDGASVASTNLGSDLDEKNEKEFF